MKSVCRDATAGNAQKGRRCLTLSAVSCSLVAFEMLDYSWPFQHHNHNHERRRRRRSATITTCAARWCVRSSPCRNRRGTISGQAGPAGACRWGVPGHDPPPAEGGGRRRLHRPPDGAVDHHGADPIYCHPLLTLTPYPCPNPYPNQVRRVVAYWKSRRRSLRRSRMVRLSAARGGAAASGLSGTIVDAPLAGV